jgi:hypothetical protein
MGHLLRQKKRKLLGHLLRQKKRKLLTVVKIARHDVPARFFPPMENTFYYLGVYKWEKG